MNHPFDQRPIIVAVAGPNGAGKTTFFHAHLSSCGLRFINADLLGRELKLDPYAAARMADSLRRQLLKQGESFVFETVFSDPVGDKLSFLNEAVVAGYTVVLCYIGLSSADVSEERVAMRVSQGGHDVPTEKLVVRYPRTVVNLHKAIRELPHVLVFDNNNLRDPFRRIAVFQQGEVAFLTKPVPRWFKSCVREL